MAILKELPLLSGEIRTNGRLAYVSQQAWVLSASIKENIVLGNEFNEYKYNEIIRACALDKVSSQINSSLMFVVDRYIAIRKVHRSGNNPRFGIYHQCLMDTIGDLYELESCMTQLS